MSNLVSKGFKQPIMDNVTIKAKAKTLRQAKNLSIACMYGSYSKPTDLWKGAK